MADPEDVRAAVKICQLVDGLPLGIELAASWARDYSFSQIAGEIKNSLDFLAATTMLDLPERHHSMRASFEHSWDLLSDTEQEIIGKLVVFPGSFSVKAAEDVAGAAFPWIMRLEHKSLIRRVAFGRYDLHPLIRQFAGQKLRQFSRKIEDQVRQQHAQYYCLYLRDRGTDLRGLRQAAALNEVELELDNIRAAWDWAVEHNAVHLIQQAAFSLFYFLDARSRWQEGELRFEKAVEYLQKNANDQSAGDILVFVMAVQGWFACRLTQFGKAKELITHSLQLLSDQAPSSERSFAHFALGFLSVWLGEFNQAWLHLATSLTVAESVRDTWAIAWARELLAEIAFESGQAAGNEQVFLQVLYLFDQLGEQRGKSRVLNYLGNIAMGEGQYPEARQYFETMLSNMENLAEVWGAAGGYSKLGQLALATGDYHQAQVLFNRGLELIQKTGDQRRKAYLLGELGEVNAALDNLPEAKIFFSRALEIVVRMRNLSLAQDVLTSIAAALVHADQKQRSVDLLALVLANPFSDRLTAERAARLLQSISGQPAPSAQNPENGANIWITAENYLLNGIPI
jgi:tetratricopeptide (TPR) repeat protein